MCPGLFDYRVSLREPSWGEFRLSLVVFSSNYIADSKDVKERVTVVSFSVLSGLFFDLAAYRLEDAVRPFNEVGTEGLAFVDIAGP